MQILFPTQQVPNSDAADLALAHITTTSTTFVSTGIARTLTAKYSGRFFAIGTLALQNNTNVPPTDGVAMGIYWDNTGGAAPTFNQAATGTLASEASIPNVPAINTNVHLTCLFTSQYVGAPPAIAIGSKITVYLAYAAVTGGTCKLVNNGDLPFGSTASNLLVWEV